MSFPAASTRVIPLVLSHKDSLGKLKKIEIIPSIFSDHNAVRLDLNYRRKTIKNSNITLDEFKYIIEKNNRAGALANQGIDEIG